LKLEKRRFYSAVAVLPGCLSSYEAGKYTLTYDAPDNGFVTLAIDDAQGKWLRTLSASIR
jgi:hypothetical protein